MPAKMDAFVLPGEMFLSYNPCSDWVLALFLELCRREPQERREMLTCLVLFSRIGGRVDWLLSLMLGALQA